MDAIKTILAQAQAYEQKLPVMPPALGVPRGAAMAGWIDHTLLKPEATPAQAETLCLEALQYQFASVCVNPCYVPLCSRLLAGSPVLVCCVVGFPLGATLSTQKMFETIACLDAGAREVDMVLHIGALKAGEYASVLKDIRGVVQVAHDQGALVKVIIEAALLDQREKILACLISQAAEADFVKTSTGFGPGGATVEDVNLMYRCVGSVLKVKAAGGVRSLVQAQEMIRAGASRLGTSSGVTIVQAALQEERPGE